MRNEKSFKYKLPEGCPEVVIKEKELEEGKYDIYYYRICKNSPPEEGDFIPKLFLTVFASSNKNMGKMKRSSQLCQMASLSILPSKEDAVNLMKKFKKIGSYLYKGVVLKQHGLILITPSKSFPKHCSFFAYIDTDEKKIFNEEVLLW